MNHHIRNALQVITYAAAVEYSSRLGEDDPQFGGAHRVGLARGAPGARDVAGHSARASQTGNPTRRLTGQAQSPGSLLGNQRRPNRADAGSSCILPCEFVPSIFSLSNCQVPGEPMSDEAWTNKEAAEKAKESGNWRRSASPWRSWPCWSPRFRCWAIGHTPKKSSCRLEPPTSGPTTRPRTCAVITWRR